MPYVTYITSIPATPIPNKKVDRKLKSHATKLLNANQSLPTTQPSGKTLHSSKATLLTAPSNPLLRTIPTHPHILTHLFPVPPPPEQSSTAHQCLTATPCHSIAATRIKHLPQEHHHLNPSSPRKRKNTTIVSFSHIECRTHIPLSYRLCPSAVIPLHLREGLDIYTRRTGYKTISVEPHKKPVIGHRIANDHIHPLA
jgi:hypothetical protein